MAGERSEQIIDMVSEGIERALRLSAHIQEMYAPQTPESEATTIAYEDAAREYDERGHWYSDTCNSEFCKRARPMMQAVLQTLDQMRQGQVAQRAAQP